MNKPAASQRVSSFDTLLDYEQRSLTHVAGRPEMIEAPGHWRGVGFRLGPRRLVSSFEEVVEILHLPPVTPVPHTQRWHLGIANVRGNLYSVVDFARYLGREPAGIGAQARLVLFGPRAGDLNAGIVVERVLGLRNLAELAPSGAASGAPTFAAHWRAASSEKVPAGPRCTTRVTGLVRRRASPVGQR